MEIGGGNVKAAAVKRLTQKNPGPVEGRPAREVPWEASQARQVEGTAR
jgi:hypothetical protein